MASHYMPPYSPCHVGEQAPSQADLERALKEQFAAYAQKVEDSLNTQVAPRLHYLEQGYRALLHRAFFPEIAERKWNEYRAAVGGKALGERCSLDPRPPICISRK